MRTESKTYSDYLEAKYLPGRRLYLQWLFYPKLLRKLGRDETVFDLGCGTGEFLSFCQKRNRKAIGVDSNPTLARKCQDRGLDVRLDNICQLNAIPKGTLQYAICDNVLEHLDMDELTIFFARLETVLAPGGILLCIVPGVRGFQCDPTHKTFVCRELLSKLLQSRALVVKNQFYHPLNLPLLDRGCYLNMQVFEIQKLEAANRGLEELGS